MTTESLRVGIRVADVAAARTFYLGLSFEEEGVIPGPDGEPVMAILKRHSVLLILDALVGMPFPDTERERMIQAGPRGLGVALGMTVDDLTATYEYCRARGCEITAEPNDEPWGDRVFECIDPYGYVWEFSTPITTVETDQALSDTAASWFGSN